MLTHTIQGYGLHPVLLLSSSVQSRLHNKHFYCPTKRFWLAWYVTIATHVNAPCSDNEQRRKTVLLTGERSRKGRGRDRRDKLTLRPSFFSSARKLSCDSPVLRLAFCQ